MKDFGELNPNADLTVLKLDQKKWDLGRKNEFLKNKTYRSQKIRFKERNNEGSKELLKKKIFCNRHHCQAGFPYLRKHNLESSFLIRLLFKKQSILLIQKRRRINRNPSWSQTKIYSKKLTWTGEYSCWLRLWPRHLKSELKEMGVLYLKKVRLKVRLKVRSEVHKKSKKNAKRKLMSLYLRAHLNLWKDRVRLFWQK